MTWLGHRSQFSWPTWWPWPSCGISSVTRPDNLPRVKSVAIIGAGPAGVTAAKYLRAEGTFEKIDIFEQRSVLAGIWNTDVSNPACDLGRFPSAIYEGLMSNLPRPIMQYHDTNFPEGSPLLPDAKTVREYLVEYGKDVSDMVHFRTEVCSVEPCREQETPDHQPWRLRYRDLQTLEMTERIYDAVVVCNGRYNDPYIPDFDGLQEWREAYPRSVMHSSDFRTSEKFTDKKVLIIGFSNSGSDLAAHIVRTCASPLLVSSRSAVQYHGTEGQDRLVFLPQVKCFRSFDRAVEFENGHIEANIDEIVFATGFNYEYPFLTNLEEYKTAGAVGINTNTYLSIFWLPRPTLAFVLLPLRVLAFPLAESQAAIIARMWSGRLRLPSYDTMRSWVDQRRKDRGEDKAFHKFMPQEDVRYMRDLYDLSLQATNPKIGKLPPPVDDKYVWLRENSAAMRRAIENLEENRHLIKEPEDLGFSYRPTADRHDHVSKH